MLKPTLSGGGERAELQPGRAATAVPGEGLGDPQAAWRRTDPFAPGDSMRFSDRVMTSHTCRPGMCL